MKLMPCADSGLLVEMADMDEVLALYGRLDDDRPDGVIDIVPAATTLLLTIDPTRTDVERLSRILRTVTVETQGRGDRRLVHAGAVQEFRQFGSPRLHASTRPVANCMLSTCMPLTCNAMRHDI